MIVAIDRTSGAWEFCRVSQRECFIQKSSHNRTQGKVRRHTQTMLRAEFCVSLLCGYT